MRPDITDLPLPDLKLIRPARIGDARGWFSEVFNQAALARAGVRFTPVQENMAYNAQGGVVRGLHAQAAPSAQAKLVRAARGRILDVAVDARAGSPTFGKWAAAELTAAGGEQLFVPAGFLHGYATREPDCEVVYLVDAPYDPSAEIHVRWDDAQIGIDWALTTAPVVSAKDAAAPQWADLRTPFRFAG